MSARGTVAIPWAEEGLGGSASRSFSRRAAVPHEGADPLAILPRIAKDAMPLRRKTGERVSLGPEGIMIRHGISSDPARASGVARLARPCIFARLTPAYGQTKAQE